MQITLTAEQEARLAKIAALENRSLEELARELLSRSLAAEERFLSFVQEGLEQADRGELLESAEVWARIEQLLSR